MCSSVSRHTHRIRCKIVLVLDILVPIFSRNVLPPNPCFMWKKAFPGLRSRTQHLLTSFFNTSRRSCDQSRKPKYWRASCEERRLQHGHAPKFIVTRSRCHSSSKMGHKANLALESILYSAEAKPRLPTCTSSSQPDFPATGICFHKSEGQDETHDTSNDVLSDFNSAPACCVRPRIPCTARTFLYHPVRPKLLLHLRRTLFTHSHHDLQHGRFLGLSSLEILAFQKNIA